MNRLAIPVLRFAELTGAVQIECRGRRNRLPAGLAVSTAAAALATTAVPTTSRETLAGMVLLLAVLGALFLRRRASRHS